MTVLEELAIYMRSKKTEMELSDLSKKARITFYCLFSVFMAIVSAPFAYYLAFIY